MKTLMTIPLNGSLRMRGKAPLCPGNGNRRNGLARNGAGAAMRILAVLLMLCVCATAGAAQVTVSSALGQLVMLPRAEQTNYLKIGLTGVFESDARERTPVNLAIVLDHSGSMSGEKLAHAKEAAIMAIVQLTPADILSVVIYDSEVEVLVPATKVSDPQTICQAIRRISAGSNTALFAGVSKGAREVRKFLDRGRVNRVILLSDGLANEGPSTPHELGELGASLIKEGISVTTFGLGLGYNEDLMAELSRRSDGNHAFIETPRELARIFNAEFGDVLSVVAQEVKVDIGFTNCRPVRLLGRDGEIRGHTVFTTLNQLYGNQEKFVLLEFASDGRNDAPPTMDVQVTWTDMKTHQTVSAKDQVIVRFSEKPEEVSAGENRAVMISASQLIANDQYKVATRLRDEGKIDEARKLLLSNTEYLVERAKRYQAPALKDFSEQNVKDAEKLENADEWNKTRKNMRKLQHSNDFQQSY